MVARGEGGSRLNSPGDFASCGPDGRIRKSRAYQLGRCHLLAPTERFKSSRPVAEGNNRRAARSCEIPSGYLCSSLFVAARLQRADRGPRPCPPVPALVHAIFGLAGQVCGRVHPQLPTASTARIVTLHALHLLLERMTPPAQYPLVAPADPAQTLSQAKAGSDLVHADRHRRRCPDIRVLRSALASSAAAL